MNAQEPFNGLGMNLGNLSRLSRAKTRSISAENFNGEKGKGGMATEGTGANAAPRPRPQAGRSPRASASKPKRRSPSQTSKVKGRSSRSG